MGFFKKHGHDCNVHDFDINSFLPQDVIDDLHGLGGKRVWNEEEPVYDPFGDDSRFHDELDFDENDLAYRIKLDTTGIINDTWSMEVERMYGDFWDDDFMGMVGLEHAPSISESQLAMIDKILAQEECGLLHEEHSMMPSFSSNREPGRRLTWYQIESKWKRKYRNARARRN